MSIIQSVFLGFVQGITEFLPVSSSGHLAILKNLLGFETNNSMLFDVLLHLGTMAAIICVFRKDLIRMTAESVFMVRDIIFNAKTYLYNRKEQDARRYRKIVHNNYRKFVVLVLTATIPTLIIGFTARDLVLIADQTLIVPGVCLILTAGLLLVADVTESGKKIPKDLSYTNGFLIGVAQGLSVLPGLSRAGTTIVGCLLSGCESRFAVKYSYIMAIPAILGAVILELCKLPGSRITAAQIGTFLPGAVVAGVCGYFCIRKMLIIVRRRRFKAFAAYCLAVGIVGIAAYFVQR